MSGGLAVIGAFLDQRISSAADHAGARDLIRDGAREFLGREPTSAEVDAVQAVAWAETNYGQGWRSAGVGSHNWGAVICTSESQACFVHGDESETGRYTARFRVYPSDREGAADVARQVLRRPGVIEAINSGSVRAFSEALAREPAYYRPRTGQSKESRTAEHAVSISAALATIERGGVTDVSLGREGSSPGGKFFLVSLVALAALGIGIMKGRS